MIKTETTTKENDMTDLFWIIETADETGAELNIAFTGTRDEARRLHQGATIHRAELFTGRVTA